MFKNLTQKQKIVYSIITAIIILSPVMVLKNINLNKTNSANNLASVSSSLLLQLADLDKTDINVLGENNQGQPASLIKASQLKDKEFKIAIDGTVESAKQADIKSQVNGQIAKKYVGLGDNVSAGETLAVFVNDDITAQLRQAEASLEREKTKLEKMKGASGVQVSDLSTSIRNARENAEAALVDGYIKIDSVLSTYVDQLFSSPRKLPSFGFYINSNGANLFISGDAESKIYINAKKQNTNDLMVKWNDLNKNLSDENNFKQALDIYEKTVRETQNLLTGIALALNAYTSTDAAASGVYNQYKGNIAQARTAVDGALSGLNAAKQAYMSAQTVVGPYELKTQEIAVDSAANQVLAIRAQREKTIITAPISGIISYFPAREGELVTVGQQIASIINSSGLQVKSYLSKEEFSFVKIGDKATIDGQDFGVVSKLAPGIDPNTKKLEIIITIDSSDKSKIVVGQSVGVEITSKKENGTILVPLDSIRISSSASVMYVLGGDSSVEERKVEIGDVYGDYAEIKSGLMDSDQIIYPILGVKAGQKIELKK